MSLMSDKSIKSAADKIQLQVCILVIFLKRRQRAARSQTSEMLADISCLNRKKRKLWVVHTNEEEKTFLTVCRSTLTQMLRDRKKAIKELFCRLPLSKGKKQNCAHFFHKAPNNVCKGKLEMFSKFGVFRKRCVFKCSQISNWHISLSSLISFIVITVYPFFSLTNQSGNYLLPPTWTLSEGY